MSALPPSCALKGCDQPWFAYSVADCADPQAVPTIDADQFTQVCLGSAVDMAITVIGSTLDWTFAVVAGALPAGCSLVSVDGQHAAVQGVPAAAGNYSFTVSVTNGWGVAVQRSFVIAVIEVTSAGALPNYTPWTPYSAQLVAVGGSGAYNWALAGGVLPNGLTLSASGLISGTPTEGGTFGFTVECGDASAGGGTGCASDLSLTGNAPPVPLPSWLPDPLPDCAVNEFHGTWVQGAVSAEIGTEVDPPFADAGLQAVMASWAADLWAQFAAESAANALLYSVTWSGIVWAERDSVPPSGDERFLAQFYYGTPPDYTTAFGYNWVMLIMFCKGPP